MARGEGHRRSANGCLDRPAHPPRLSAGELLSWYVDGGWEVDRAHRRLEIARNDLRVLGDLEPAFTAARVAHEEWLDATLLAFTTRNRAQTASMSARLARQGDIHDQWVRDAGAPVAYVWVDALRFELATDLADGLRADGHSVELHAAVAAAPTITPVGMANLTPGAGAGLSLELDGGDLAIRVDGSKVATVPDRVARLRAAHGDKVLDRTLEVVAGQGEKELKRALGDADLLLVRSQELDAAGESGMLNAAWSQFNAVLDLLRNLVARLGQAGVRRIVIAADHGFVTLSRGLGPNRSIDPPAGGTGRPPPPRMGRQGRVDDREHAARFAGIDGRAERPRPDRAARARRVQSGRLEAVLPRRALAAGAASCR